MLISSKIICGVIVSFLLSFTSANCQSISIKSWYNLERTLLNEIYYNANQDSSNFVNQINDSERFSFFSLKGTNSGNRYKKYDKKGNLIALAVLDSIDPSDNRARFIVIRTFSNGEWQEEKIQENKLQENWKFYTYNKKGRTLIRERIIEYYLAQDGYLTGVAYEIEHFASSTDSIFGKNLDSLRLCDGLLSKYISFKLIKNYSNSTPRIIWQGAIIDGNNVGTSKEYFPYSGEIAREVNYKNGKVESVKCYSYVVDQAYNSTDLTERITIPTRLNVTIFEKNKIKVYDVAGNLIRKSKNKLNGKVPRCQCDNAYYERATQFIREQSFSKTFLKKYR